MARRLQCVSYLGITLRSAGFDGIHPPDGAIRFGSSYARLRPELVTCATFCFPDSLHEPLDIGDADLLPHLCRMADASGFDDLDESVEAHVHGPVRFDTHVEALVLDPCFADTDVEAAASRLGCPIEFHPGFQATPDDFEPDYRGRHIVQLARSLGYVMTPSIVGDATRVGAHPPYGRIAAGTRHVLCHSAQCCPTSWVGMLIA